MKAADRLNLLLKNNMTEDDTFNALRKWTFEDTREWWLCRTNKLLRDNEEEFFKVTGWRVDEFFKECFNR